MSILTVCVVVRGASRLLVSASEVVEDDSTSDCSSVVAEDMVMPNVTVLCWCPALCPLICGVGQHWRLLLSPIMEL